MRVDARRPAAASVGAERPSRANCFRWPRWSRPTSTRCGCIVDIDVVDAATQRDAARALHALGPQVGAGQGRPSAVVVAQPRSAVRRHRLLRVRRRAHRHPPRPRRGRHPRGGDRLRTRPRLLRCPTPSRSPRGGSPNACAPRTRWGTATARCRRCSGLRADERFDADRGHRARARRRTRRHVLLTHGAGGSRESPMLVKLCAQWAGGGWLAVRYDLPYRRRRPKGPPSGSATADQAGIVEAVALARTLTEGPVHRRRPFLRRPDDVDGRRRWRCRRRRAHPVLLSPASARQARAGPHRAPARASRRRQSSPMARPTRSAPSTNFARRRHWSRRRTEVVEVTGGRHDLGSKTLDVPAFGRRCGARTAGVSAIAVRTKAGPRGVCTRHPPRARDASVTGMSTPPGNPPPYGQPAPMASRTAGPARVRTSAAPPDALSGFWIRAALRSARRTAEVAQGALHRVWRSSASSSRWSSQVSSRSPSSPESNVVATNAKVGDCITDVPSDSLMRPSPPSDCKELHGGEVYAVLTMPDGEYPGADDRRVAEQVPSRAGRTIAPKAKPTRRCGVFVLYPTQQTWDKGDRAVTCVATLDPKRTGSMKG